MNWLWFEEACKAGTLDIESTSSVRSTLPGIIHTMSHSSEYITDNRLTGLLRDIREKANCGIIWHGMPNNSFPLSVWIHTRGNKPQGTEIFEVFVKRTLECHGVIIIAYHRDYDDTWNLYRFDPVSPYGIGKRFADNDEVLKYFNECVNM